MATSAALIFAQGMGSGIKVSPRHSPKALIDLPPPDIHARDVAAEAGLTHAHVYGGVETRKHILEMTGNGVAVIDFDNDGWQDLVFVNGTRLGAPKPAAHRLYKNLANGRFRDVSEGSGLVNQGWAQGICAGDYDNDGAADLLITYYGHNALYRNVGAGKFENVTAKAGLPSSGKRWNTGCTFLDYDRDGLLDVFVSNYVEFDIAAAARPGSSPYCFWRGIAVFCGPKGFPTGHNALFHNVGGRFVDVTRKAGMAVEGLHYGLGVVSTDFDNDGWQDVYVACDSTPSLLFRNNRDGTFTDVAVEAGAAYGEAGQEQGSMGVAAADYNNDGLVDLVRTNFMDETSTLYRNAGRWFFEDATYVAGLGIHTNIVGWGVAFPDVDRDGWKDILMVNGHIYPELEKSKAGESYRQSRILYQNVRNGTFRDVTAATGPALQKPFSSRGLALGDFDNDGSVEAVVVNMNEAPSLFRFEGTKGNALIIELVGRKSNRSAIGARVVVDAGGVAVTSTVQSGSSFASQSDFRLHFGLGAASAAEKVTVYWPGGSIEELTDLSVNQWITIREGDRIVKRQPLAKSF